VSDFSSVRPEGRPELEQKNIIVFQDLTS